MSEQRIPQFTNRFSGLFGRFERLTGIVQLAMMHDASMPKFPRIVPKHSPVTGLAVSNWTKVFLILLGIGKSQMTRIDTMPNPATMFYQSLNRYRSVVEFP